MTTSSTSIARAFSSMRSELPGTTRHARRGEVGDAECGTAADHAWDRPGGQARTPRSAGLGPSRRGVTAMPGAGAPHMLAGMAARVCGVVAGVAVAFALAPAAHAFPGPAGGDD